MAHIEVTAKDGQHFNAFIALPEQTPAPAIIVIQEIFGVNDGMRGKCAWLAQNGFVAICPDLFWRIEPGIELSDQKEEELQRAFELFGIFDVDLGVEDLLQTFDVAKDHEVCSGKVGAMGYCLGGKLAYLMAARSSSNASVGYYGVGIDQLLPEANNIQSPLMLHIAEEDEYVDAAAQKAIHQELGSKDAITLHSYPGMGHAFTRLGGDHYDADNATLADQRTIDFFKKSLK